MLSIIYLTLSLFAHDILLDDPAPAKPTSGSWKNKEVIDELGSDVVTAQDKRIHSWQWKLPKLNLEEESFETYTPKPDPARKPGILVFISPHESGNMFGQHLKKDDLSELLDKEQLLYIGANAAGNKRNPLDRLQLALTAISWLKQKHQVDEKRIVVSGFSGGGKMACIAGRFRPDLFRGVLAIGGPTYHKRLPAGPGKLYPADMALSLAAERKIKGQVRFLFLSCDNDFNLPQSKVTDQAMQRDGYQSKLLVAPELGHEIPAVSFIRDSLKWLLDSE